MDKTKLTVIEGNLLIDPMDAGGVFIFAESTATRLMGVLGVHTVRQKEETLFHQFFYIDTEEYGLDDYQSLLNPSPEDVEKKKAELFGALGGTWVELTEKESLFLIKHYSLINKVQKLPLPEGISEYGEILTTSFDFTVQEKNALWKKTCIAPHNDYELINYFIMRMAAKDTELLRYLSTPDSNIKGFAVKTPGTLLKNEIFKGENYNAALSSHTYKCVSLLDLEKVYQLVEGEITVLGSKVINYKAGKAMPISSWETSLILNKPEYIIHASLDQVSDSSFEPFKEIIKGNFSTITESAYDFGTLFMIFRQNNNHVRKKVYRLDQDTIGIICLLETGEIIFAGNDTTELEYIESTVLSEASAKHIHTKIVGSYKFTEPILIRFIDSDFESFQDFLDYLQGFEN